MKKQDKKQNNQWLSSQDLNKISKKHGIKHATELKRLQDSIRKLDNFFKYYE
tara:strand:+ start:197 stop:352 length:156 start_codon:yes stop_codon:yes gene_type:complete